MRSRTQMRAPRHFPAVRYTLTAAQPFDLFRQTPHLECVLTLKKGAGRLSARPNSCGSPDSHRVSA
ncbi:MAG TPA: hypothetical protein VHD62_05280 [Opitutaceae bacterium]|nr:hypothetical protein [Opitutaceae bacterium]